MFRPARPRWPGRSPGGRGVVNAVVRSSYKGAGCRTGRCTWTPPRPPTPNERRYWSVDPAHPNQRGHRLIACPRRLPAAPRRRPRPDGAVGPAPAPHPSRSSPPPNRPRRGPRHSPPRALPGSSRRSRRTRRPPCWGCGGTGSGPASVTMVQQNWIVRREDETGSNATGKADRSGKYGSEHPGARNKPGLATATLTPRGDVHGMQELHEWWPLARLKVRDRLSELTKDEPHDGSELRRVR